MADATHTDTVDDGPQVPAATESRGFEGDIQDLVKAGTQLIDASVRPVIRILDTISDNLGDSAEEPRIPLSQISETSNEVISSSVRLAERVVNLAFSAITPRATGRNKQGNVPTVAPGGSLRIPMSVENSSARPMSDLAFHVAALVGPTGTILSVQDLAISPAVLNVAPNDFEKLNLVVEVPKGTMEGDYSGELGLSGNNGFRLPFRFRVVG